MPALPTAQRPGVNGISIGGISSSQCSAVAAQTGHHQVAGPLPAVASQQRRTSTGLPPRQRSNMRISSQRKACITPASHSTGSARTARGVFSAPLQKIAREFCSNVASSALILPRSARTISAIAASTSPNGCPLRVATRTWANSGSVIGLPIRLTR